MKKIFVLIIVFFYCFKITAQSNFLKSYGTIYKTERVADFHMTSDGGFIVLGGILDTNIYSSYAKVFLLKTDSLGNTQWTRLFKGPNVAPFFGALLPGKILLAGDGGYYISAFSGISTGNNEVYFFKTDSLGNVIWSKGYSGIFILDMKRTTDGGFLFTSKYYCSSTTQLYFFKTDSVGNFQFGKMYNCDHASNLLWGEETLDGGFIFSGATNKVDYYPNFIACLLKCDSSGNFSWLKTYAPTVFASPGNCAAGKFLALPDSGFVFFLFDWSVSLVRTNKNGNVMWSKKYYTMTGSMGYDIIRTSDMGILFTTTIDTPSLSNTWQHWLLLTKLDSVGNIEWQYPVTQVLNSSEAKFLIAENSPLNYSIVGALDNNFEDIFISKINFNENTCYQRNYSVNIVPVTITSSNDSFQQFTVGQSDTSLIVGNDSSFFQSVICNPVITGSNYPLPGFNISISPNPATNELVVASLELGDKKIEIYNVLGKEVFEKHPSSDSGHLTISVADLPSGIYFLKVKGEKEERVAKFVKQ